MNSQPLGYKPSALAIELISSKAIAGKDVEKWFKENSVGKWFKDQCHLFILTVVKLKIKAKIKEALLKFFVGLI